MSGPQQPDTLGNVSLGLGVASPALVFGIGFCTLTGLAQGWIQFAGLPLYICGASSAFLGLLAIGLGIGGLFGQDLSKATAVAGLLLGLVGVCLFLAVLATFGS